ncbi:MAG: BCCT family transporter [Myxococcota bacterium]|nr:BCCT family transporter [Myxococcota bacterium]
MTLSRFSLFFLFALVVLGLISIEDTQAILGTARSAVVDAFDWFFVGITSGTLCLIVLLAAHPRAKVRLGPEGAPPDFSRFSWFAMLFSAGLASGLLYWAVAEPILHFQGNPTLAHQGLAPLSASAAQNALSLTIFHWGLQGSGLYVLGGLAIALYSYRHGQPMTIRSALYPLLGDRWIGRWPGALIDLLALLGTVFGVSTSAGLSAASLNAALEPLLGFPVTSGNQIAIVFLVCFLGLVSALSGVGRGIRRLSEINVWVSAIFLLAVLLAGPTGQILSLFPTTLVDYGRTLFSTSFWIGSSVTETEWQSNWTIFYWAWWLAWMPFVSLFIARISRGRTIREFVMTVMAVPTLVILAWMVILGGTALHQELLQPGSISEAVNFNSSLGVPTLLSHLGSPEFVAALTGVAAFLLFTWLITSLDSATLVLCHLVGQPDQITQKILWGTLLAAMTSMLIWVGGLQALQAASIVIGLPLALITSLIAAGLVKDLIMGRL